MEESEVRTIGKYEILGPLGRGSMGMVYKARDPEIGRVVAIKTLRRILPNQFRDADTALERFRNEARSAGILRHPNIITIFDVNRDGDMPYIVMDFVEGETLDSLLDKRGRLPLDLTLHYLNQVAAGIDYAHLKGVIHKDIKPGNILVDRSDNVFILDFGIATLAEGFPDTSERSVTLGTPGYMSPEQILNEKLDARSDLFSMAIVAFQCLTGKRAFPGDTFTEVIANILNGKPQSLTQLVPELPLALEAEFERALEKSRDRRFSSADDMIHAFAVAVKMGDRAASNSFLKRSGGDKPWESIRGSSAAPQPQPQGEQPQVRRVEASSKIFDKGTPSGFDTGPVVTRGKLPGDLFSRDAGTLEQSVPLTRSLPLMGTALALGALTIGAIILIQVIFFSRPDAPAPAPSPAPQDAAQAGPLVAQEVESVPEGASVSELSNKQLLGVLTGDFADDVILSAMQEARRRNVPGLVDAAVKPLSSDSYIVRVETLKILAQMNDRRIVPHILPLLDDPDPLVRIESARTLGSLGDRAALGYLAARLVLEDLGEVKDAIKESVEKINGFPVQQ